MGLYMIDNSVSMYEALLRRFENNTIPINEKYISDGIGDDYKEWLIYEDTEKGKNKNTLRSETATRVFLSSPTGTGKTCFLLNNLLPYAIETNRSIVYISNRSALRDQVINALEHSSLNLKKVSVAGADNPVIFRYPNSNGYITVLNYQAATSFLSSTEPSKDGNYREINFPEAAYPNMLTQAMNWFMSHLEPVYYPEPYYVYFDEVHYFFEDAVFNKYTWSEYTKLMERYIYQVQIFTSATIKDFVNLYAATYTLYLTQNKDIASLAAFAKKPSIKYYRNSYSHPVYNVIFYTKEEFLLDRIKETEREKWLLFVSSKKKGEELRKEIRKYKTCIMLSSEKKHLKTFQHIVEKRCFEQEVLIATKVLDNGVSIADDRLSNIVIPFTSETEFVQMLGRKRFTDKHHETVNLYVEIPTIQKIRSRIRSYTAKLREFQQAKIAETLQENVEVIKNHWNSDRSSSVFEIICKNKSVYLYTNSLAEYYMSTNALLYEYLEKNHFRSLKLYQELLKDWLGGRIAKFENLSLSVSLTDFLEKNVGRPFEDLEQFYKDFLEMYHIYCGELVKDGCITLEEHKDMVNLRQGKGREKATMNRALSLADLPYTIKKSSNAYVIEETD